MKIIKLSLIFIVYLFILLLSLKAAVFADNCDRNYYCADPANESCAISGADDRRGCYGVGGFGTITCTNNITFQSYTAATNSPPYPSQYPGACYHWEIDASADYAYCQQMHHAGAGEDVTTDPDMHWSNPCYDELHAGQAVNRDWGGDLSQPLPPEPPAAGTIAGTSNRSTTFHIAAVANQGYTGHATNGTQGPGTSFSSDVWTYDGRSLYTVTVDAVTGYPNVSYSVHYNANTQNPHTDFSGTGSTVSIPMGYSRPPEGGGRATVTWTFSAQPPPTVTTPSCIAANYTGSGVGISWTNSGVSRVDISTDPNFGSYANKAVSGSSTTAPNGFSGSLNLQPDTVYYTRTYNGVVSTAASFNIPLCNFHRITGKVKYAGVNPPALTAPNYTCPVNSYDGTDGDSVTLTGNGYNLTQISGNDNPGNPGSFYFNNLPDGTYSVCLQDSGLISPFQYYCNENTTPGTNRCKSITLNGADITGNNFLVKQTPPVCNPPTLDAPANNACIGTLPTVTSSRNGTADRLEIFVDDSNPPNNPYIRDSGISGLNPFDYALSNINAQTYYWTAQATHSNNLCTLSPRPTARAFTVDQAAPNIPANRALTCISDPSIPGNYLIHYSWSAPADLSCGGLHQYPYWSQTSTHSDFSTGDNLGWYNSWTNGTFQNSTSPEGSYAPGSTVYARVRSRDQFDNQSNWSAVSSVTCPTVTPTVIPTPTGVPTCSVPTLTTTAACLQTPPTLTAARSGSANQIQFAVDNEIGFINPWVCNSGWLNASNPQSYLPGSSTCSPYPLTTGLYYWSAKASSSTNACLVSTLALTKTFSIDTTVPSTPATPVASYDAGTGDVTFSWTASTDTGCGSCSGKASKYWVQGYYDGIFQSWFVNNGLWVPKTCTAPSYSVSCINHEGETIKFFVPQAKDNAGNISPTSSTFAQYTCPPTAITPTVSKNTPTPTPTPVVGSWYKVKNASFHKISSISNQIPASIAPFDGGGDDDSNRVFNTGDAGLVTSTGTQDYGTGKVSEKGFFLENYTKATHMTASTFIDYIKSKKQYTTVTDLAKLQPGLNLYTPASGGGPSSGQGAGTPTFTINSSAASTIMNALQSSNEPIVIIFQGAIQMDVNLNVSSGGADPLPLVLMAAGTNGKININSGVTEIGGIYIADNGVDFSYDQAVSTNPLKIKGNIMTTNTTAADPTKRQRPIAGAIPPSLFIDVDQNLYLDLLPYLSTSTYDWNEGNP